MATKKFMANEPGYVYNPANQSAAETARLRSNTQNETQAESNRLISKQKILYAADVGGGRGLVNPPFVKPDNAYAHNSDNIVTSTINEPLNLQFQPNILDKYDAVTYHWKLFITTAAASSTGRVFDPSQQTIIAETGVSELTIENVEIVSHATPSVDSGTGTYTSIKFDIHEPGGAGMIDKIFYQAIGLGLGNWNVIPFYLQLEFRARTTDASEADNGQPGVIGNLKWLWVTKLTSISVDVSTTGAKYSFVAIPSNDYAQSNIISSMQTPTVLGNLSTFADAMGKLQDKLNEDQIFKLIGNYDIPDSFRIVVDPELAGYNITPINSNTNSARSSNPVIFSGKDATFPKGTSLDKIVDSLLSQTADAQQGLTSSSTPGGAQSDNLEFSQLKPFWRITTESRPIKFDPRRTDYAREHTFYIYKYDKAILNSTSTVPTGPLTLADERRRLAVLAKKKILKKKYNYIFTGLNDQVIDFNVKINNAFAQAQSRMSGIYTNSAMHTMGVTAQENAADNAQIHKKITAHISLLNNSATGLGSASKEREDAESTENIKKAVQAAKISDVSKAGYNLILGNAKPESRLNFVRSLQESGGLNSPEFIARDLAIPRGERVSQSNLRFISDVDQTGDLAKQAYSDYVRMLKGTLRPIAKIDSMQQQQIGQGVESNSDAGVQQLSSMFAVALHSAIDGTYQMTDITIKGDPFWLFPQPITDESATVYKSLRPDAEAFELIMKSHLTSTDAANLYGTDNFIVIRFRTPRIYDQVENDTGENSLEDVSAYSGVFQVITVTHTFEKGTFRQKLLCQLDPYINILNFKDQLDRDAATLDRIPVNEDLTGIKIPAQFNKTNRLVELNDIPVPSAASQDFNFRRHGLPKTSNIPIITSPGNFSVPGTGGVIG